MKKTMNRILKTVLAVFLCFTMLVINTNRIDAAGPGKYYKDNKLYYVSRTGYYLDDLVKISYEEAEWLRGQIGFEHTYEGVYYDIIGGDYYMVQEGGISYGGLYGVNSADCKVTKVETVSPFYFNVDGTVTAEYYTEGSSVIHAVPTKDSALFAGWYTTATFEDESEFTLPYTVTATDVTNKNGYTLYARFIDVNFTEVPSKISSLTVTDSGIKTDLLENAALYNTEHSLKNSYVVYKENSTDNYSVIETDNNGSSSISDNRTIEQLNAYLLNGSEIYVIGGYTEGELSVSITEKNGIYNDSVSVNDSTPCGLDTVTFTANRVEDTVYYIPYSIEITDEGENGITVYPDYDYQEAKATYSYQLKNRNVTAVVDYIEYYCTDVIDDSFIGVQSENVSAQNKMDLDKIYKREKELAIQNGDNRDVHIVYEEVGTTNKYHVYPNIYEGQSEYSLIDILKNNDNLCILALGGAIQNTDYNFSNGAHHSNYLEQAVSEANQWSSIVFKSDITVDPPESDTVLDFTSLDLYMNNSSIVLYDETVNCGKYTIKGSNFYLDTGILTSSSNKKTSMTLGDTSNQLVDCTFNHIDFAVSNLNLENVKGAEFYECSMSNVTVQKESNPDTYTPTAFFGASYISGDTALDVYGCVDLNGSLIQGDLKVEKGAEVTLDYTNVVGELIVEEGGTLNILGGCFSEDPTPYVMDGYVCIPYEYGDFKYSVVEFNPAYSQITYNYASTVVFENNLDERSAFVLNDYYDYWNYVSDIEYYIKEAKVSEIINDCRGNIPYDDCMAVFYLEIKAEEGNLMKNSVCLTYDIKLYGDVYGWTSNNEFKKLNTTSYSVSNSDFVFEDADDYFYIALINPGLNISKVEHVHDDDNVDVLVKDVGYEQEDDTIYVNLRSLSKIKFYQDGVDSALDEAKKSAGIDIAIQIRDTGIAIDKMAYLNNSDKIGFKAQTEDKQSDAVTKIENALTVEEINGFRDNAINAIKEIEKNASDRNLARKKEKESTSQYKVVNTSAY